MLTKAVLLCACLGVLALSPVPRQLDSKTSADENRILFLENAWNNAEEQKNTKPLEDLLDNSLTYTDYDGTLMDKAEFLAAVRNPALRTEQIASDSVVVRSYGDSAVVTGIHREKGVANGKPYVRRVRFTDTWVSQDNLWQCVASQSSLITSH